MNACERFPCALNRAACKLQTAGMLAATPIKSMRLSRPPPLRNLRAFCIAARHCSFKVAADELFLTPSAVSHQMKELEETLGVRLFERKTRALELKMSYGMLRDPDAETLAKNRVIEWWFTLGA